MELLEYWNLIIKRKLIILLSFFIVVSLTVTYLLMATPLYEANCKLLLTDQSSSSILGDMAAQDMMLQAIGKADPINTQIEVIKTRPIINTVISKTKLTDDMGEPIKTESLQEAIKVQAIRNTNIIQISYKNKDPRLAAKVLNTLANEFIIQNKKINQEEMTTAKFFIKKQLEEQKNKVRTATVVQDQLVADQIYATLLEKHEEIKINEAANIASIKLIEPAIVDGEPVWPSKKKLLLLSIIAGFALGFGLALLFEYIDDTPDSIEEIKKLLPYNVLGMISLAKGYKTKLFVTEKPLSGISESFRMIITNLKFKGITDDVSSNILITSAIPGEGKSTISSNLALSFASAGKKVLLINMDLRRPSFHKIFDQNFQVGLTDYLIKDNNLKDVTTKNFIENLDIISAGTIPPNPTELIASKRMTELVSELKKQYDIVIYDCPPATIVSETLDLASKMDGVIIATDISSTSIHNIKGLQELISDKHLPVLGTIVNKISATNGGYGYSHGYSYDYSQYFKE